MRDLVVANRRQPLVIARLARTGNPPRTGRLPDNDAPRRSASAATCEVLAHGTATMLTMSTSGSLGRRGRVDAATLLVIASACSGFVWIASTGAIHVRVHLGSSTGIEGLEGVWVLQVLSQSGFTFLVALGVMTMLRRRRRRP